jgi:hypothetical protein
MNREAVRQQVSTAKCTGVRDNLFEVQPDGRIVGGDDGTSADTDDGMQWHALSDELPEDAEVRGAAQTARAQHDANAHTFALARARIQARIHLSIGQSRRDECNLRQHASGRGLWVTRVS